MKNQEKYLDKAIREIKQWRKINVEAANYPHSFSNKIIAKLKKAKEADSVGELDQRIKEIYHYQSDSGPLGDIMPSLNELGVAVEKLKNRS